MAINLEEFRSSVIKEYTKRLPGIEIELLPYNQGMEIVRIRFQDGLYKMELAISLREYHQKGLGIKANLEGHVAFEVQLIKDTFRIRKTQFEEPQ